MSLNQHVKLMHVEAQCPICKKPVMDEFRPFCSLRCKEIDLHRWLSEVYMVPTEEEADEESE